MLEKPGTDMPDEGVRRPEIHAQWGISVLPASTMVQASSDIP